ncbi:hypothetical protein HZH66_014282 [Vespula vulgaris]|uniref:Uncharacterized protein n=1 Tax=Vespula vulgaris TaxID=7454 RepID=A0A834J4D9_VESVU|nr:hypothetical protein HZH66_014282 [Vespula vulgaris]
MSNKSYMHIVNEQLSKHASKITKQKFIFHQVNAAVYTAKYTLEESSLFRNNTEELKMCIDVRENAVLVLPDIIFRLAYVVGPDTCLKLCDGRPVVKLSTIFFAKQFHQKPLRYSELLRLLLLSTSSMSNKSSSLSICLFSDSKFRLSEHSSLIFCMSSNIFLTEHIWLDIFRNKTKTNLLNIMKFMYFLSFLTALKTISEIGPARLSLSDHLVVCDKAEYISYSDICILELSEFRVKFLDRRI